MNTHNSAYDNGTLSEAEIEQLYGHLAEESKTEKSFLVGETGTRVRILM